MVDVQDLVFMAGFTLVARLVGREYVLLPVMFAIVDSINPVRGAFVAAVSIIIMGGVGKVMEV